MDHTEERALMSPANVKYQHSDTYDEILSQAVIWQEVLNALDRSSTFNSILESSNSRDRWIFVGCGTSFYLAEAAAFSWTALTGQPAHAVPGSEVLLYPDSLRTQGDKMQAVVISRSGRTSEAVRAAKKLRQELGIPTFGFTCAEHSPLEQACDASILVRPADEKSTVMTRSFTSLLIALQFMAAQRAGNQAFRGQLATMAERFAPRITSLASQIEAFVQRHSFSDYIFLGQGAFHGIAREAALKVMEMSSSYSQFFHTLEFRHGPKTIVSSETCLTFYLSETGYLAETEVLLEMKELGAVIGTICTRASDAVKRASDLVVEMDLAGHELALLAPYVVPSQLMGFFTGIRKGLNPDAPRNLTRVVMLD